MTPAAYSLLAEIVSGGSSLRPLGDARLAQSLQDAGLATLVHLDEMPRIRVTPTDKGRRLVALRDAQKVRA